MRVALAVVLCCFQVAVVIAASVQAPGGREYAETMLLLSESDFDVRLAAKVLYRPGPRRQASLDLLAEVMWTTCSGKRKMEADALSWSAKALGASGQARYAALLDYCLANVNNDKSFKYLSEARSNLDGKATASFVGGKINLVQVRDQLLKSSRPRSGQVEGQFDALRKGRSIDEIYAAFGRPDAVQGETVTGRKMGHGPVQIRESWDTIAFKYDGAGTVRFRYDESSSDWRVADATSEKDLYWSKGGGRFGTLDEWIATGDEDDMIKVSELLRHQDQVARSTLDRVADRIYELRVDPDDELSDSLAYLCKVLAKSEDGRYKKFLEEVGDTAGDKTLRRHARRAAGTLPDSAEPAYVPVRARK